MKRPEPDRLLREILDDGDAADWRAASLARGLDFLQRRRRRNHAIRFGAAAILPALLMCVLVFHRAAAPPPANPSSAPRTDTAKVKIINDEELFALFPHRAVALIGSPGHQQLVFLDHGAASEQP